MIKISDKWISEFQDDYFHYIKKRITKKKKDNKTNTKFPTLISNDGETICDQKLRTLLYGKIQFDVKMDNFVKELNSLKSQLDNKNKALKGENAQEDLEKIKNEIKELEAKTTQMESDENYQELCSIKKYIKYKFVSEGEIKHQKWRDLILGKINVSVCPYCNRNYVDIFKDENVNRSMAELDHFYSQHKYPYLALSLYNFIPSCKNCNSKFKGDNVDSSELIYPYEEEFGDNCTFTNDQNFIRFIYENDLSNSKIKLKINKDSALKNKISNSVKVFRLEEIYNNHVRDAKDIIYKKYVFNDRYINDISKTFEKAKIAISEKEVEELIFGVYDKEDDVNIPIGKFKRDIYNQYSK